MDKRFLAILAAIVIIFVGIVAFSGGDSGNKSSGNSKAQPTNHVTGEGKKTVTLVEYGDFQCPVCGRFEPVMQQLRQKYASDWIFQFRNLPLTAPHPNAFAAARAAEAASLQNKFWEMHDTLYTNQTDWANSSNPLTLFKSYAGQLKMDTNKFAADYASSGVNDSINADMVQFGKDYKTATGSYDPSKDEATPTFFLNGKVLDNADLIDQQAGTVSLDKFSKIIDAEIAKQSTKQ